MKVLFLGLVFFFLCSSCTGGEKQNDSQTTGESEVSMTGFQGYEEQSYSGEDETPYYEPSSSYTDDQSEETDYSEGVIN